MILITIHTHNAAFEGAHLAPELARILRRLADTIEQDQRFNVRLRDVNGNTVGTCEQTEAQP